MKPEKLTLKNIGPFRGSHTVNFTELGDIFLIYGKTGAGKTTIFDAISYAFYSEAPGSRKGIARQMRSQFAQDGEESAVELEFSLAGRRYRIRRTLGYEKIGVRSGKLQNVAEEVSFERYGAAGWENKSSTNKSETDKQIQNLIGLSADEFSKIVLLPQGEFARFLQQNSTDRKAVLSKLFPVDQYVRVIELTRTRAREAELAQKETVKNILALRERFNENTYESERKAVTDNMAEIRKTQVELRKILTEKTTQLEQARAVAQKQEQLRELESCKAELEQEVPENEARKKSLDKAHRAAPLLVQLSQLDNLGTRLSATSEELVTLGKERTEQNRKLADLENLSSYIEEIRKEREGLLLRKEQLRIAAEIASGLDEKRAERDRTQTELERLRTSLEALQKQDTEGNARLAELEAEVALLDQRNDEYTRMRGELEHLKQLRNLAQEYEQERENFDRIQESAKQARKLMSENAHDIEIARAELTSLEVNAEQFRTAGLAQTLAAGLEDGKPCPVCGSLHHPAPAERNVVDCFTYPERINAAKRRCDDLESRTAELAAEKASKEANLRNSEDRVRQLIERFCSAKPAEKTDTADDSSSGVPTGTVCITEEAIPSPKKAADLVQEAAKKMQEISDALNRSRAAWRDVESIRKKKSANEPEIVRLIKEIQTLDRQYTEQNTGIAGQEARYREAFSVNVASGSDDNQMIPDPAEATDAFEKCTARILTIDGEIAAHESRLTEERARCSSLEGKKSELERSLAALSREKAAAETNFSAICKKAGFADVSDVRNAALSQEERTVLETAISAFTEALASTTAGLARLEKELANWHGPDAATVSAEMDDLDDRITETGQQLEKKSATVTALDNMKEQWDDLDAKRIQRTKDAGRLAALANDLTGKNPAGISFDAWILGMYLEEITVYANTRLERMSEGRYRIRLNDSYRKGNNLSGLELEIFDSYTGRARPAGTLSGGETFMASISLALGLADSIQTRSGGIQLDAVFIDEGFGSLDEASLERAITILDEIRGSRVVGLISHVAELRTRIPNRIEIVKTPAGSSIRKE